MWNSLAQWVLRYKVILLILLMAATAFMGWQTTKLRLSYDFSRAIPINNPKYQQFVAFKQTFGEDGNVLVIGNTDKAFFTAAHFAAYKIMLDSIKGINGVESILSVPTAILLKKDEAGAKLIAEPLFSDKIEENDTALQNAASAFNNLPFYHKLLSNPQSNAYLAGITINKAILASADRTRVVNQIVTCTNTYEKTTGVQLHLSGLPFIRTQVADRIKSEMNWFLFGSLALAFLTLLLFFRSFSATLMSIAVVIMGVVFSTGTMVLLGYKITLLTALVPPLIIVIGIPNCIYFINKYHMAWEQLTANTKPNDNQLPALREQALITMISKMGVVTLFCNIAAGIGFGVFALTKSALLKEFGVVAGLNILFLFIISLIFIPSILSYLPPPKKRHTKYLRNKLLENVLISIEYWVVRKKSWVFGTTVALLLFAVAGIMRLKTVGFIVDDLPKTDKIFKDLKWFEANFGGVMPLEIVIDSKRKGGVTKNLKTLGKIDELTASMAKRTELGRSLSLLEGLKFAKQAYYDGDSLSYIAPNEFDMAFLAPYMKLQSNNGSNTSQLAKLVKSFTDSSRQKARISINMADIGTEKLAILLDSLQKQTDLLFDSSAYKVTFTGSSITFLEGSRFIINGLKESILWAFLLIALCMLYLFRNVRILICSLIPNLIPLIFTAGLMGWVGVAIKPSTVLVFSVALGIAIDVTIRFLVNYKQELPTNHFNILATTTSTIRHTGISIIYTSLVLVAGFVIFMFSGFGGTFALGWLTSFTLLVATITNLVLLPVLMLVLLKKPKNA